MTSHAKTTVYYDGACPLCRAEIEFYAKSEGGERLILHDISDPETPSWSPVIHDFSRISTRSVWSGWAWRSQSALLDLKIGCRAMLSCSAFWVFGKAILGRQSNGSKGRRTTYKPPAFFI